MKKIYAYHGSEDSLNFENLIENSSSTLGIHFGTKKAATIAIKKYENIEHWTDDDFEYFFSEHPESFIEAELAPKKLYENATDEQVNSKSFMSKLKEDGYDCVSYINQFEDVGSVSYVVLNPEIIKEI